MLLYCAPIYRSLFTRSLITFSTGGVAEWLIAPVLKTGRPQGLVSSNLTPSAFFRQVARFCWPGSAFGRQFRAMSKRGVSTMVAVLGLGVCLAAPTNQPEKLLLNGSSPRFPALDLSDARYFTFATAFNWLEPAQPDVLPPLPSAPRPATLARDQSAKDSSKEDVDVSRKNLIDYAHGEIGFLYGRGTGKFEREVEQ